MKQNQQIGWILLAALVTCSLAEKSVSNGKRQNAASPAQIHESHVGAEADAETFNNTGIKAKNMDIAVHKVKLARNGKVETHAAQKKQNNNPLGALGTNLGKIFKKGNNPLNSITNTLKNVANPKPAGNKKPGVKKGKNRNRPIPPGAGSGGSPRQPVRPPSDDYSDIEVDENGEPVVLKEEDIPEEEGDYMDLEMSASQSEGEEFPPYGGDYSQVDEGPVNYPDENPNVPPKRNNNKRGKGKKGNKGKKGGKPGKKNNKKKKNLKKAPGDLIAKTLE